MMEAQLIQDQIEFLKQCKEQFEKKFEERIKILMLKQQLLLENVTHGNTEHIGALEEELAIESEVTQSCDQMKPISTTHIPQPNEPMEWDDETGTSGNSNETSKVEDRKEMSLDDNETGSLIPRMASSESRKIELSSGDNETGPPVPMASSESRKIEDKEVSSGDKETGPPVPMATSESRKIEDKEVSPGDNEAGPPVPMVSSESRKIEDKEVSPGDNEAGPPVPMVSSESRKIEDKEVSSGDKETGPPVPMATSESRKIEDKEVSPGDNEAGPPVPMVSSESRKIEDKEVSPGDNEAGPPVPMVSSESRKIEDKEVSPGDNEAGPPVPMVSSESKKIELSSGDNETGSPVSMASNETRKIEDTEMSPGDNEKGPSEKPQKTGIKAIISTGKKFFGWSNQNEKQKLQEDPAADPVKYTELYKELESTKQKLKKEQTKTERLSNLVMKMKGLRDGDTFPDAKTYSSLESDFKRLFEYEGHEAAEYLARSRSTQTCRKVSLTSEDKELIGELFRTTYESCKVAIVGAIFKDVFQPSLGAEPPSDATRERASVYGVCVATTPALQSGTKENDMLRKSISDELFITQVAKHISPTTSPDDHSSHTDANEPQQPMVSPDNPLRVYLEKAIEVAWGMLTIQPPMVIAFPSKEEYNHAVHDIDIKYWSKVSEYDLVFFHPAVYYTFNEKKPAVKAEVGNRKCDTCSK